MTFEEYWDNYGELHASFCNGDIKMFARDFWNSSGGRMTLKNIIDGVTNLKLDSPSWGTRSDKESTYMEGYNDGIDSVLEFLDVKISKLGGDNAKEEVD